MSKKQSLTRALALSLLLTVPFYEAALAAPGQDTPSKNETWDIDAAGGSFTHKTENATSATGDSAEAGGKVGDLTVQGKLTADANITGNIEITGTAGIGGNGAHNGTMMSSAKIPGADGGAAGNGGSVTAGIVTAQGALSIQAQDISITAIAGKGGDGGSAYSGGGAAAAGGIGGAADAYGLKMLSASGVVTAKHITVKATAAANGTASEYGNSTGDKFAVSGSDAEQASATGIFVADSTAMSVSTQDMHINALSGNGGDGVKNSGGANTNNKGGAGGKGGAAVANGLDVQSANTGTFTANNINVSATAGNGGKAGTGSAIGSNGGDGGISKATGLSLSESNTLNIQVADLQITSLGGAGSQGGSSYVEAGAGGIGGAASAYGLNVLSTTGVVTAKSIVVTATAGIGGDGGYAGKVFPQVGNKGAGGNGGTGGDAHAHGLLINNSDLTVSATSITATAAAGKGGNGNSAGDSGSSSGDNGINASNGGNGGQAGNAHTYGLRAAGSRVQIAVDQISAIANGAVGGNGGRGGNGGSASGAGNISGNGGNGGNGSTGGAAGGAGNASNGATQGNAGQAGQNTTEFDSKLASAYGIYAEAGSVVNLSAQTAGGTITIGAKASGAQANTAYAVYADGASVMFGSNALLNDDTTGTTDNSVITYLNNATLGFAYSDAAGATNVGHTVTGGTLNLQGSNTLMVNTDLENNTADKIVFDSLTTGSSTAEQYITIGYDPIIELNKDQKIELTTPIEILDIANLNGQSLNNFVSKKNTIDGTLYKYGITPDIDINGGKIEITGITTEKLVLPSESVMTAGDTITGMGNLWRIEGNNLMKRMGDLRSDPEAAKGGVWARYYRGELSAAGSYGRSLSQDYTAFQGGIDKVQDYHDGRLYTGIAINHISSNSGYSSGSGEGSSTGLGLYTSWLGEKGHYVDVILRASRLNSNFKSFTTAGVVTGDYSTWAYGLSAEYGYRHKMQSGWFVEPQAELSFGHMNSASYTMSNGARVENGSINSVTGRLGFILGKEFKTAQRPGNVYLKGSLYHEFGGKGSINAYFGNDHINADGSPNMGTWYELGLGTNLGIAKNSNLYVDAVKTFGGKINTKWQLNAGVRVAF